MSHIDNIDTILNELDDLSGIEIDNLHDDNEPILKLDMNEINSNASSTAKEIAERLSGYYFDEEYIKKHPYIPMKIKTVVENMRRLLKMLSINEHAQDSLIHNILYNGGKAMLYSSLKGMQDAILSIQKQLDCLISELEDIFRKMQEECELSFNQKDKEELEDGTNVVRGSREFIEMITQQVQNKAIN